MLSDVLKRLVFAIVLCGFAAPAVGQGPDVLACQDWRQFRDADFIKHAATMESINPCVAYEPVLAGGIEWRVVRMQQGPQIPQTAPLVVVLHDNEDAALVGALSLLAIRDVQVVMLDTDESRDWGGVDPNRLFVSAGSIINACPYPLNLDAAFAQAILRDWSGQHPVISLHSNAPGILGDGEGGRGSISMLRPQPHQRAFPGRPAPDHARLSDPDNLIFITGLFPAPSPVQNDLIRRLQGVGLNVLYSQVTPLNQDCSLSDFLTLRGQSELYFNVEVEEGDDVSAVTLVRRLLFVLENGLSPRLRL
mgnify:FL=1